MRVQVVASDGLETAGLKVLADGKGIGETDGSGTLTTTIYSTPGTAVTFDVEPTEGMRLLHEPPRIKMALTNGQPQPVQLKLRVGGTSASYTFMGSELCGGARVIVNGEDIGEVSREGDFFLKARGEPGREAAVMISGSGCDLTCTVLLDTTQREVVVDREVCAGPVKEVRRPDPVAYTPEPRRRTPRRVVTPTPAPEPEEKVEVEEQEAQPEPTPSGPTEESLKACMETARRGLASSSPVSASTLRCLESADKAWRSYPEAMFLAARVYTDQKRVRKKAKKCLNLALSHPNGRQIYDVYELLARLEYRDKRYMQVVNRCLQAKRLVPKSGDKAHRQRLHMNIQAMLANSYAQLYYRNSDDDDLLYSAIDAYELLKSIASEAGDTKIVVQTEQQLTVLQGDEPSAEKPGEIRF